MLRSIYINNYKLFDNFHMDFSEGVNLICGPNGSGKSSLGEVLHALVGFLAMPEISDRVAIPVSEAFPFEVFCRWKMRDKGHDDLYIRIVIDDEDDERMLVESGTFEYSLSVRYDFVQRICGVWEESLKYTPPSGETEDIITFTNSKISMWTDDQKPLSFYGDWSMSGLFFGSRNNSKISRFREIVARITVLFPLPTVMFQNRRWTENFPSWRFSEFPEKKEMNFRFFQACNNFIPGLGVIGDKTIGDRQELSMYVNYSGESFELLFGELSDGQKKLIVMYFLLSYGHPNSTINPKTLNWHHKEAYIFEIVGEPPRIKCHKNDGKMPLNERLIEMEWSRYE